jgi:hypothetical protein
MKYGRRQADAMPKSSISTQKRSPSEEGLADDLVAESLPFRHGRLKADTMPK